MNELKTIRYMGIKSKLLKDIIPEIKKITPKNGIVCDIMAGSGTVSYALKEHFTVITNDIQEYSYTICKAVIENNSQTINHITAKKDLEKNYLNNLKNKKFNLFEKIYSDTYFSKKQCCEIDSIRYAISLIKNKNKKYLYLTALMCMMCSIQSTPGHFAQYMPSTHKRIVPLRKMNAYNEFLKKCDDYNNVYFNKKNNKCYCLDYKLLLKNNLIKNVDTVYLDSPYSQEQYSRFYHVLETLVKYDYPKVEYKAKYREDRFLSEFCYKKTVKKEFQTIVEYCSKNNINLVISYSNKALYDIKSLEKLCKQYYLNVKNKYISYSHSTQGKGTKKLKEVIISCCKPINK